MEDYQSVSLGGTDLEGQDEPAVKRRKQAKEVRYSVYNKYLDMVFMKQHIAFGGSKVAFAAY